MKIECFKIDDSSFISNSHVERVISKLIKHEKPNLEGEIRFIFINDEYSRKINKQFLNHDYPTDVLSFPYESDNQFLEGEVYVNVQQAFEQASFYDVDLEEELLRLVIHGTLHLLGDKDSTSTERERMREKEDNYLKKFEFKRKEL